MGNRSITIQLKNCKQLIKTIKRMNDSSEKVIKYTISDLRRQGPATVRKHVSATYNIDKREIQPGAVKKGKAGSITEIKQAASISITGKTIETFAMHYEGRPLTPLHFGMSPKKPKALLKKQKLVPGKSLNLQGGKIAKVAYARQRKPYDIKLTIMKGHPEVLKGDYPTPPFLAPAKKGSDTLIPFQRTVSGKYPVEAIHGPSVPQMIDNPEANAAIYDELGKYALQRLTHHYNRFK